MSEAVLDTTEVRRWKRHREYRASDAKWHWEVPEHWKVKRLKYLATMNPSKAEISALPKDTEVSFLPMEKVGEDGSLNLDTKKSIEDVYQGFTYFRDGDVLVAKITPCFENGKGALAVGLENGIGFGTTEFHVLRSKGGMDPKYLELVTRLHAFRGQGISEFTGAAGQQRVPESFLTDYVAPLPPLREQRAIAAFLDRETARIDALVAKKQRLIELLEEKRQAVISNAVTKGLDPNVEYSATKLFWLDVVPKSWTLTRLKFVAEIQTGLTLGKNYGDRELVERPYLRVANVQDGYLDLDEITRVSVPVEDVCRHELQSGDVLMTEGGDFDKLGRGFVWEGQISGCLHQNHVFAVRPNQDCLLPHYLSALMTSFHGKTYFTYTSQQSTNLASTNSTKLGNFPIPLPSIEQQRRVLSEIAERSSLVNTCIRRISDGIAALRECRIALVSAAVTGQIDVRDEVQLDD